MSWRSVPSQWPAEAATGFALLGCGITATLLCLSLPPGRDTVQVAFVVLQLEQFGMWSGCSDPSHVLNQACGFPAFAALLVRATDPTTALRIASLIGTALFLPACYAFFREFNSVFGLARRVIPLQLWMTFGGAMVLYEYWGGDADTLFAAGGLMVLVVLRRLLRADGAQAALLAASLATLLVAIQFIHARGTLVLAFAAMYGAWAMVRGGRRARSLDAGHLGGALALLVALAFALAGAAGVNPLLNWNASEPAFGLVLYPAHVISVSIWLLIAFGPLLLLLPWIRVTREDVILAVIALGYGQVAMMTFGGGTEMGYYVFTIPFLVLYLARALDHIRSPSARRALIAAFSVHQVAGILLLHTPILLGIYRLLPPSFAEPLDPIRMGTYLEIKDQLSFIDRELPPEATLHYIESGYRGDSAADVYQRGSFMRSDLRVASANELPRLRGDYLVLPIGSDIEAWASANPGVTILGHNVARIEDESGPPHSRGADLPSRSAVRARVDALTEGVNTANIDAAMEQFTADPSLFSLTPGDLGCELGCKGADRVALGLRLLMLDHLRLRALELLEREGDTERVRFEARSDTIASSGVGRLQGWLSLRFESERISLLRISLDSTDPATAQFLKFVRAAPTEPQRGRVQRMLRVLVAAIGGIMTGVVIGRSPPSLGTSEQPPTSVALRNGPIDVGEA